MRTKQGGQHNGAQRRRGNGTPPTPLHKLGEAPALRACLHERFTGVNGQRTSKRRFAWPD